MSLLDVEYDRRPGWRVDDDDREQPLHTKRELIKNPRGPDIVAGGRAMGNWGILVAGAVDANGGGGWEYLSSGKVGGGLT